MNNQQAVAEFMKLAGQAIPTKPTLPPEEVAELRIQLLGEEVDELGAAFINEDLTEVADAIGDILFVAYGAAVDCGLDAQGIFEEVVRSNKSKFIDGHRRADGKWMKGPSFVPPDLSRFVGEREWTP